MPAQPLAALLPYGCGVPLAGKAGSIWRRRSKRAERMVLSIPHEIESAGAMREAKKTNPEPSVSGSGFERSCDRMSEK